MSFVSKTQNSLSPPEQRYIFLYLYKSGRDYDPNNYGPTYSPITVKGHPRRTDMQFHIDRCP